MKDENYVKRSKVYIQKLDSESNHYKANIEWHKDQIKILSCQIELNEESIVSVNKDLSEHKKNSKGGL